MEVRRGGATSSVDLGGRLFGKCIDPNHFCVFFVYFKLL